MPKRLLRLPHLEQHSASDCLAACAAMMLGAIDVKVSYQALLEILNVASWGTPHRNFQRLEQQISGIRVLYKQGVLTDLFQAIDEGNAPTVFLWTGELPYWTVATWHAVVIAGYDEEHFFLNDPAFQEAPQIVLHGDLDLAWIAYDSFYATIERE